MRTRFAPSPTGLLHIGNARTAINAYLYTLKMGGEYVLRIDDTDVERSREEYVEAIRKDLAWLGIKCVREERQSSRLQRYNSVMNELVNQNRVYACYDTPEELEIKRKSLLLQGKPPIYDRSGTTPIEGRKPHYRFRLADGEISWIDEVRGKVSFHSKNLSDPIIVRESGIYTYMFPSVIDDIDFAISHIIRGEDHISNTAVQIQMFEALGAVIPTFAHLSLVKSKEGKLSKRKGSATIAALREENILPITISSFLSKMGTSENITFFKSIDELASSFDIAKFSHSQTIYDEDDIYRLNAKLVHSLEFNETANVGLILPPEVDSDFWNRIRHNVEEIGEITHWIEICKKAITPIISVEDTEFLAIAASLLPENLDWNTWTSELKEKTSRKGKDLFMPLRKALTAMEHGPSMAEILPLIARNKILGRLNGQTV
jgi:glutamyl-tRNA synthetase